MAKYHKGIAAGVALLAFFLKNQFDVEIAEGPLVDALMVIGGTVWTVAATNKG